MSQHDGVIDNASGATVRADINNLAAALLTRSSGTSAPSTTYANMVWVDTTLHVVKERNEGNSAWIIRHRTDAEGVLAKTALYTLAVRDFGKLIDATSGTWTLTLMAAATATDGFWFELRNSGTGVITIDGDSSETIDGLTTIEVHPGEFVRLQCNGTLWRSDRIVRLGSLPENIQTDTYSVLTSDRGKLCIANKGTAMTFNLPAAATAGKGFVFFYKNIGAGTLTLDGNSTETIDGATTKSVAQNESGALECDGSNWRTLLTGGGSTGNYKQRAYAEYATHSSSSTNVPKDDTVPTSSEGTQTISQSFTPTSATSRVRVRCTANAGSAANGLWVLFLLYDGTAVRVAPVGNVNSGGPANGVLEYEHVPGDTSAHTYALRVGPDTGSLTTIYFNGISSGRLFGGTLAHTMVIEELTP